MRYMSEALVRVIARLQFETQAASEVIIDQAGRSFLRADGPAESTSGDYCIALFL